VAFSLRGGLLTLGPQFGRTCISVPSRFGQLRLDLCLILLGRSPDGAIRIFDPLLELREVVRHRHRYPSFLIVPRTLRRVARAVNLSAFRRKEGARGLPVAVGVFESLAIATGEEPVMSITSRTS
jgi:hypothetical protein